MRFASVAEVKNHLSAYLARARKKREPIVVTHHGRPYALIQPMSERDLRSWRTVGLRHPSTVRVSKLLSVDKTIVKRVIGDLVPDDLAGVETILRQALALA